MLNIDYYASRRPWHYHQSKLISRQAHLLLFDQDCPRCRRPRAPQYSMLPLARTQSTPPYAPPRNLQRRLARACRPDRSQKLRACSHRLRARRGRSSLVSTPELMGSKALWRERARLVSCAGTEGERGPMHPRTRCIRQRAAKSGCCRIHVRHARGRAKDKHVAGLVAVGTVEARRI